MSSILKRWLAQRPLSIRIIFVVGIASFLFWHAYTIFEFYFEANREFITISELVTAQVRQFAADNALPISIYDYDRVRINASKLNFIAPIENLTIAGRYGSPIYESVNSNKTLINNSIFEYKIGQGRVRIDYKFGVHFDFASTFGPASELQDSEIRGTLLLDSEVRSVLQRLLIRYISGITFMLFQVLLILYVVRRVTNPLTRFTEILSNREKDATQLLALDDDIIEVTHFAKAYNLRLKNELDLQTQITKNRADAQIGRIAAQVAHDIRSPLAALQAIDKELLSLPEDTRLLVRSAVGRIRDIANNLIEKNRRVTNDGANQSFATESDEMVEPKLLAVMIELIVSEKRIQNRARMNIDIDFRTAQNSYGLFAVVRPTEFSRVISNLIENSIEAISTKGKVVLTMIGDDKQITISIEDDGQGISPADLEKIGNRGFSIGKKGGSGLGFYHAKKTIESWGGRIVLNSTLGVGTKVQLILPRASTPRWFKAELQLDQISNVVVLDDDFSIHQIWQGRFDSLKSIKPELNVISFSTPTDFRAWVTANRSDLRSTLFLLDFELAGSTETGISLAHELGIAPQSTLVTSRFEEPRVLADCELCGLRLMPKGMAGLVPIVFTKANHRPVTVLLDDDNLTHLTWQIAAKDKDIELKTFSQPKDFFEALVDIERDAQIYVDSNLGDNIKGESLLPRLSELGFTNIHLATGEDPSAFKHLGPEIEVLGKAPPF